VVTLTLNRPERKNALNPATWRGLLEAFQEIRQRTAEDRVVVLTGAGGDFCSGADLAEGASPNGDPEAHRLRGMQFIGEVVQALHDLPQPIIAKIRGVAAGAGLSLALGCDLTVASSTSRLTTIFAKRGLSLDAGASWVLPRLVGLHRAKELAFFGEIIPASEAERLGLVNRVVPEDQLDGFVDGWAAQLAAGPPLALSMTKRLLVHGSRASLAEALDAEAFAQAVNFSTADTAEAMRAFLEKRPAHFQGR